MKNDVIKDCIKDRIERMGEVFTEHTLSTLADYEKLLREELGWVEMKKKAVKL